MYILGIETSCDETAVALLKQGEDPVIVAEEISSQVKLHEAYGGVVPELASREHLKNLPLIFDRIIEATEISASDISLIGVTRGPGLKGCLLMGLCFAKGLASVLKVPLIGINHIEGHLLAPLLDNPELDFPFLGLVVSGGHTEIVEAKGVGDYRLIARTIDDAAGEAFDKSAHLLGFPYPGGPKLAELADSYNSSEFKLPKVMREAEGFSFSGLKTAIALLVKKNEAQLEDEDLRGSLAYAIQDSIVDALCFKLKKALKKTGYKKVVVTGGVSANMYLRKKVQALGVKAFFPDHLHCMDNAAMIAHLAALRFERGEQDNMSVGVVPRWPVETIEKAP